MRKSTELFISRLKEKHFPDNVSNIYLFGSEVYGIPNIFSDIDIAIVSDISLNMFERFEVEEIIESCDPPYECQYVYIIPGLSNLKLDVRNQVFEQGVIIYES